jgi:BirA family transcriptional regulator, biotin operon repressor / biotin---[acetyl-CoA-carboxylase] ligase
VTPGPARVPLDPRRAGGPDCSDLPEALTPERILDGLGTRWLGRSLHCLEETDSTMRVASELARQGAPSGTAILAERQTAGRGRLGRSFHSPARRNLYVTFLVRPDVTAAEAPAHVLAAAIAVADAVAGATGSRDDVEIKWPNDVLLGGLKVAGILLELGSAGTRVDHLAIGIGVNLNVLREELPDEFRERATSLRSHLGKPVDRAKFTRRLCEALEPLLERCEQRGFAGVLPAFESWFRMTGRHVRVAGLGGDVREGVVLGVDAEGALRLAAAHGEIRVVAGDVTLLKEPA